LVELAFHHRTQNDVPQASAGRLGTDATVAETRTTLFRFAHLSSRPQCIDSSHQLPMTGTPAMKTLRLLPLTLVLALAGPLHAQDFGPGGMGLELFSLSDGGQQKDASKGKAVSAERKTSRSVESRKADDHKASALAGRETGEPVRTK
jgi:hypothetical protein